MPIHAVFAAKDEAAVPRLGLAKYQWTPDRDFQLKQAYKRSINRQSLAIELTRLSTTWRWPRHALLNRARHLGLSVLPWKPWNGGEIDRLRSLAGTESLQSIARTLHRSPSSVKQQLSRLSLSARMSEGYSILELQQLLGVGHSTVRAWISRKWLTERSGRITEESTRAFVRTHMDQWSFKRADEAWVKGLLNPNFGYRPNVVHPAA